MATTHAMTQLETTIVTEARSALRQLQTFANKDLTEEERSEALDFAAEANALIKLALFDSGLGNAAASELRELEPFVGKALSAIRGAPKAG